MLDLLKQTANTAYTENGAVDYFTTGSECLDLFSVIGAIRNREENRIWDHFAGALAEDADTAMKILFYARDIREGLGERHVFRVILRRLAFNATESVLKNLELVPEFGRYDDLLCLLDTPASDGVKKFLHTQLLKDLDALEKDGNVSLLGKWLPSINASNRQAVQYAVRLARSFRMKYADYRRALSALRARIKIIENNLREKDYSFDYGTQPSKAMLKYRGAFFKNDRQRYDENLDKVSKGTASINTGTLMPYELVRRCGFPGNVLDAEMRKSLNVMWKALPDYTNGENAIVVADGSGSMYRVGDQISPHTVAQSLAIYFAERNTGAFAGHFITFSNQPRLVEIKGSDLKERVDYCHRFDECANTDLKKVFELILAAALRGKVKQKDLPSTVFVISDMEFDRITDNSDATCFEYAGKLFEQNGYRLPKVVFWNVDARGKHQPVTENQQGVVLVSGCTARIFQQVAGGKADPLDYMLEVIGSPRYAAVKA